MTTFAYQPDWGVQVQIAPRIQKYQFGDGYEMRRPDGINTMLETWDCTFKRNVPVAEAIYAQLKSFGGVEAFVWTTPDGYTSSFVCDSFSKTKDSIGWNTVKAMFREVPEQVTP